VKQWGLDLELGKGAKVSRTSLCINKEKLDGVRTVTVVAAAVLGLLWVPLRETPCSWRRKETQRKCAKFPEACGQKLRSSMWVENGAIRYFVKGSHRWAHREYLWNGETWSGREEGDPLHLVSAYVENLQILKKGENAQCANTNVQAPTRQVPMQLLATSSET
jgi:hypothetical protein